MRILVMTAVTVERDAVLRGLGDDKRFVVLEVGVGPVLAGVNTAKVLAKDKFDLVISAGIGGGFLERAEVGSLVVATEIIAGDLGAETPEGFASLDELGFGSARVEVDKGLTMRLLQGLQRSKLKVNTGPILTLSTVTGTAESAAELLKRVPEATAEAMEGFGVALAAKEQGIPTMEIRAISNLVGPRDRSAWRIDEALKALEAASKVFAEVL